MAEVTVFVDEAVRGQLPRSAPRMVFTPPDGSA